MPKSAIGWSEGEEGVTPDLLAVRSMLRGLPKLECSPGFEYRLQRKLTGEQAGVKAGSTRSWTLGWAGAGLGFATALAIAFFAFDMNGPGTPNSAQVATGVTSPGKAVPAPVQVGTTSVNQELSSPPAGVAEEKQMAKSQTTKDTTAPVQKTDIPQDLIHTTGAQK